MTDKRRIMFAELNKDQFQKDYVELSLPSIAIKYDIHIRTINDWARKMQLPRKSGRWRDADYQFTDRQVSVMIGSMLGDGSLEKCQGRGRGIKPRGFNSRYQEIHGIQQYGWLKWKKKQLEPLPMQLKESSTVARKNLGNGLIVADESRRYDNCSLRTAKHPLFTELEKSWYKRDDKGEYVYKRVGRRLHRIKIAPIGLQLTKLALAVWYMDDGSNSKKSKRCCIYTLDFSATEVDRLVELIKGLGFTACWKNRYNHDERFYVTIGVESYLDFINMVKDQLPDLPSDVQYKVDLSQYKVKWQKSPDYHPRSLLNDVLVKQIMDDAKAKIPQKQIASKYNIPYKKINDLLCGGTLYKSEFADGPNYRSTTGVAGVTYSKQRKKYIAQISLSIGNGKYFHLSLGHYKDKQTAAIVASEAYKMRDEGIVKPLLYKQLRLKYRTV